MTSSRVFVPRLAGTQCHAPSLVGRRSRDWPCGRPRWWSCRCADQGSASGVWSRIQRLHAADYRQLQRGWTASGWSPTSPIAVFRAASVPANRSARRIPARTSLRRPECGPRGPAPTPRGTYRTPRPTLSAIPQPGRGTGRRPGSRFLLKSAMSAPPAWTAATPPGKGWRLSNRRWQTRFGSGPPRRELYATSPISVMVSVDPI